MHTHAIFSLLAAATVLPPALIAQSCLHLAGNTPGAGTPDPRPLGNGNPVDPTYSTQRYQVQVPTAVLGTQNLKIVELFVAPADSQLRTFTELQVRMGHNPNPLTTQMATNFVGFTARPVQHNAIAWQTTANQWQPLGMAFAFDYKPANGMLVLEFFVRGAGASGGGGVPGMRTDPGIPFVWTSGQGYSGTQVAGGGIKLRFCTDYHGYLEYEVGGCPGSNGLVPQLTYAGSAQIGSTVQVLLADGLPSTQAVLVWSFTPRVGPFDLVGVGAPACLAYVFPDVATTHTVVGGTSSVSLALPLGLTSGLAIWNQWLVIDPTVNSLGISMSNLGRFLIGN